MAELQFPDIVGRFQQGLQFGQQQADRRNQSRLSELAQAAYSAPDAESREINIGEAIGVDPQAGLALQSNLQGIQDRKQKALVQSAAFLGRLPPEQQQAAYTGLRGRLSQEFPDLQLPEAWEQAAPTVAAINQAYGGQQADVKVVGNSLVDSSGRVIYQAPQRFLTESGLIEVGPEGVRELRAGEQAPQGGMPIDVSQVTDPNVAAQIQANPQQAATQDNLRPWTVNTPDPYGGNQSVPQGAPGGRILPTGAGARAEQLRLAQEANRRAEQAADLARRAADRADREEQRKVEAARTAAAGGGLSAGELKKVRDDFKGIQDVEGDFKALEDALADVGPVSAAIDPAGQGRLGTSYNNARAGLRILYNTGVLQPGELPLLESALRDPTSWRGVIDPRTRPQIAAQLKELRGLAERRRQTLRETYPSVFGGGQPPAAGGPSEVRTQAEYDALPSGAIYTEDGQQYRKP